MVIGDRLRAAREQKNLSQADVEKRSGLLCCYLSRVENGHTVPSIATLEKLARALEMPLHRLFYDAAQISKPGHMQEVAAADGKAWGNWGKDDRILDKFRRLLKRTPEADRKLLLHMAQKMAARAAHSRKRK